MKPTKLLVLDGSHGLYKSIFQANTSMITDEVKKGDRSNYLSSLITIGTYMYMTSIFKYLRIFPDYYPIILFDTLGSSDYRKSINPSYKGNRKFNITTEAFSVANSVLRTELSKLKVPTFGVQGFEADDVAFILSEFCSNQIRFVSEDEDWKYFIRELVDIYRPIKDSLYTYVDLYNGYMPLKSKIKDDSVSFRDILLLSKAIKGDSSDNIKGVDGVGKVTIRKVIPKYYNGQGPKGKVEKKFFDNLELVENNLKILGYSHLHDHYETVRDSVNMSIATSRSNTLSVEPLLSISTFCNSSRLSENADKHLDVIRNIVESDLIIDWK